MIMMIISTITIIILITIFIAIIIIIIITIITATIIIIITILFITMIIILYINFIVITTVDIILFRIRYFQSAIRLFNAFILFKFLLFEMNTYIFILNFFIIVIGMACIEKF